MVAESKQQIRETSLELLSSSTINHPICSLTQRAMFWRPAYLESSAWIEHIPFAFWLVEAHHPRVFVELGIHYGVSYFAFCQAVEKLELNTRCFAVDTWKGDEQAGLYDERVFEQVKAYNEAQYSGFSRLVRSTFDDALSYFSDGSIDLLHIDGLHTFEAARDDFESWLPKLSERAVVVMHDTNVRERSFGVFKLFESLRERYSDFEFIHGHGLGVLKVGPRQTDQMLRLFRSAEKAQTKHAMQEAFARLGLACVDSFSAAQQKTRAHNLKDQSDKQKKQLEAEVEQLTETISILQQELDLSQSELGGRNDIIERLEEKLATQAADTRLLNENLAGSAEEIERLNQALVERESELIAMQHTQQAQAAEMEALQQDLESRSEEIVRERWYLGERDAEINRLTDTLAAKKQELDRAQNDLRERNEATERLELALDEHLAEARNLKEALAEKSEENYDLTRRLSERDAALKDGRETLKAREEEVVDYEQEGKGHSKEIVRLEQMVKEREWELDEILTIVNDRFKELAKLTQICEAAETTLQTREDEFANLKQLSEGKSQELTATSERLAEALVKQRASAEELGKLGQENASFTRRLSEVDAALKKAREALETKEGEKVNYEQERNGHSKEIARLEQVVKERERELVEVRDKQAKLTNERQMQLKKAQQAHQTLEAANTETIQENELLLLQLHQVQEELEETFLSNQNLKQAYQRLEAAKKEGVQKNEKLSRELQQVREELLIKEEEIEKQRQRVTKLKQTVSWKITAPMRGIARPFKRPNTEQKKMKTQVKLLKTSGLFDEAWYLAEYSDVASEGADPVEHYLRHGAAEGRNPSSVFNTQFYQESNPDVAATELNPLVHFVKFGKAEGRVSN